MLKLTNRQKKIDLYLRAAVNLYGFVTPKQFLHLYNKYNKEDKKLLKRELVSYFDVLNEFSNHYKLYLDAIINNSVSMMVVLTASKEQKDKKYFEPTKEEFLKYANKKYYQRDEFTQKLEDYLNYEMHFSKEKIDGLLEKLYYSILIGEDIQKQLSIFVESGVFNEVTSTDEIKDFLNILLELINNARQWRHCGFTAIELYENSVETEMVYQA